MIVLCCGPSGSLRKAMDRPEEPPTSGREISSYQRVGSARAMQTLAGRRPGCYCRRAPWQGPARS
eukprot:6578885-Alexandrium_andersonii.AAC.1